MSGHAKTIDRPCVAATVQTPIGPLGLVASTEGLCAVEFNAPLNTNPSVAGRPTCDSGAARVLAQGADELERYFKGTLTHFTVPLAPVGTEFQQRVWRQLSRIPFASTTTYGAIARSLGDPKATRAVGLANGRNPLPIIVPCHRVIGADGSLTGFGGGIERKQWLLEHERQVAGGPGGDDFLLFSALTL